MAERTVALCNGKLIGIETIYTVTSGGHQIDIPEKKKFLREKSRNGELFCPCGCGANLILVAPDNSLRERHFRIKEGTDIQECQMKTEGKKSINSKIVLKCWLDDKLQASDIESRVPICALNDTERRYEFTFLVSEKKIALSYWYNRGNIEDEKLEILEENKKDLNIVYVVDERNDNSSGQYPEHLMKIQNKQGYCLLLSEENSDYMKATMRAVFYAQDINGYWQEISLTEALLAEYSIDDLGNVWLQNQSVSELKTIAENRHKEEISEEIRRIKAEEQKRLENIKRRENAENKLKVLLESQNYKNRLKTLRSDKEFLQRCRDYPKEFKFYAEHKQIPFFIDIPITGEMIFKCDRRVWQGIIFNRWIYGRKEDYAKINIFDIFEQLKTVHSIPIDYDLAYNDLKPFGNSSVSFSLQKDVIKRYMYWLETLGFIINDYRWATVCKKSTLVPPNSLKSRFLKEALESKDIDIDSPEIDRILIAEMHKRQEKYEREEKEKQIKEQEEAARKVEENALMREKEKYERGKWQVQNQNFNQNEKIYDEYGFQWFLCTECKKLFRGSADMISWKYSKGVCRECTRKRKEKDTQRNVMCNFSVEWNPCPHLEKQTGMCKDNGETKCSYKNTWV